MYCVFLFMFYTSLSLSLQLALRAPSSLSRGQDYVSNVHSTVAPPSRPPHSAVVGTAITAGTWTNRRTCAPVSQSLSVKQTYTLNKPFSNVVECDYSIPQGDGDMFAKANFWTGVTNS